MQKFLAWLRQPTNIHALGVTAFGIGAGLSNLATGNTKIDMIVGLVAYVLVHFGINDNSGGGMAIAQLTTDIANAAVQRKLTQVAPELFGEGVQAVHALLSPTLVTPGTTTTITTTSVPAPLPAPSVAS